MTAVAVAIVTTIIACACSVSAAAGARRSLAGVAGWTLAALLALGLNDWDWGADGLVIHMLAIGVPATMAAAVAIDLLARPGSLAIGERAGLVVAPRPLRAVRQRIAVLRRYRELVRLARQEGFGPLPSAGGRAERTARGTGVRLRRVLEEAGGVYVKLGQIAATRSICVPPEVCAELAGLQNQVAPEPASGCGRCSRPSSAADVDDVFAEFDWEPLAAASIGQTYRARLRTGEPVVVKVQRPGIEDVMERDLAALALLADVAQRRTPFGQGVRSGEMLDQFASQPARRARLPPRGRRDDRDDGPARTGISGPRPEGLRRAVHPAAARAGALRGLHRRRHGRRSRRPASTGERSAEQLLRSTLDQVLRIGFFHADPHPGNVFAFADGTLGLIDFGAVGRLDPIQQAAVDRHARRHRPPRRRACCATASSGWPRCPRRCRRNGWSGRSPA